MTSKIERLLELWGLEDMVRAVNEEFTTLKAECEEMEKIVEKYDSLVAKIKEQINYYSCGSCDIQDSKNRIMIKKELSNLLENKK